MKVQPPRPSLVGQPWLELNFDQPVAIGCVQLFQSPTETLVFYMGLVGLPIICEQLVAHGRDPTTPVALVEKATSPEQRVITGTLGTMTAVVEVEKPEPPTLIIVGDVVRLAAELGWYSPVEGRVVR